MRRAHKYEMKKKAGEAEAAVAQAKAAAEKARKAEEKAKRAEAELNNIHNWGVVIQAPQKNKQLSRQAIASDKFPDLIDRIIENNGKLDLFLEW